MALAVAFEPKPPLHEYEFPPIAVKLMDVVVQFNSVVLVLLVMPATGNEFTVIVPVAFTEPQPPVNGIL